VHDDGPMFVEAPEAWLHTVSFGAGATTLLAVNGWSSSWEAWQPTFEHLSATMRCLSYDTRGCGTSTGAAESIVLDALVADVFDVLDAYGVERCVLAGESLGGFVAVHAALAEPGRFERLVLVGAPPVVEVSDLVTGARADYPATVRAFVRLCLNEPGWDADHLVAWGESLFAGAGGEVAARLFECCEGRAPDLAALTVPTTVIHGTEDLVVPLEAAHFLASQIPGADLVELEGAGHVPTVTRGRELAALVNAAVVG
jgi:sigma-B regulation protein RsbQ